MVVASYEDSSLYEVDAETGAIVNTLIAPYSSATFIGPSGLTWGPDGNLYISAQGYGAGTDAILQYNFTTNTLATFISSSVLDSIAAADGASAFEPAGLQFGPDGNLYVSLNGGQGDFSNNGEVIRFHITSTGGVLSYNPSDPIAPVAVATAMLQPDGLTFGVASGTTTTLYVADSGDDNVVAVADATTSPAQSIYINGTIAGIESPVSVNWGPDGDLYISDVGPYPPNFQGNVFQYNPTTTAIQIFTPSSGAGDLAGQFPSEVLFDGHGNVLTANLGPAYPPNLAGSINQYSGSGAYIQTLLSSGEFPDTGPGTSGISPSQLILFPAPVVTANPSNQGVNAGGTATFVAAATSELTPSGQWQVSTDGGAIFSNVTNGGVYSGATTETLVITGATAAMNGYEYQEVFTNSFGTATTTAVTLTVDFAPTVTANPTDSTIDAGGNTSFAAAATGNPTPSVQWQLSTNGGAAFNNITNGGVYSGATTLALSIVGATAAMNSYQYRAIFSNTLFGAGSPSTATTTAATLTVDFAPTVTTDPTNTTVNAGSNASFTATANDGFPLPTTVQWQFSTNGGTNYFNATNGGIYGGVTTTTLTVLGTFAAENGYEYRAVFSNAAGLSATTTSATLGVDFAPTVTANPISKTIDVGSDTSFVAAATGNPTPAVQWQVSTNGGATFNNVSNGGVYSGATTTTLSITGATAAMNA
jgi:hypothetical protein